MYYLSSHYQIKINEINVYFNRPHNNIYLFCLSVWHTSKKWQYGIIGKQWVLYFSVFRYAGNIKVKPWELNIHVFNTAETEGPSSFSV